VGETNDSWLNDIRRRIVTPDHVLAAIRGAQAGPVAEGCIGAGTGTVAFGWKGGIGASSRCLPANLGGYTVGVLVQSNFGGVLQIAGIPAGQLLGRYTLKDQLNDTVIARSTLSGVSRRLADAVEGRNEASSPEYAPRNTQHADGSIMLILATDAPLSDRNLTRLARRAFAGLARTGAAMSNGSGDYALAFSTAEAVRRTPARRKALALLPDLPNDLISPLFLAAIEATEEAIYNSLLCAVTVTGYRGRTVEALPLTGWLLTPDS